MLNLLLFAPCEKVIIADDKTVSLIGVLDTINVAPNEEFVKDTATQFDWFILSIWLKTDPEDNKAYKQRTELFRPDGELVFSMVGEFSILGEMKTMRISQRIGAFPVGIEGTVQLVLSIREATEESEWQKVGQYPIHVNYLPQTTEHNVSNEIEIKGELPESAESV